MTDTTTTAVMPFADGDMDAGERRHAVAMWKQAQQLARSSLAGDYKDKPADIYAIVAYADQFGVAPGNALQMIWIIAGRIVPRAEFLAAITRRAGHEIRFEESSSERCTVAIRRRTDDYWQRVTFTFEDATRAGLGGKDLWKKYTADMLCHATVRRAVKRICPDVLLGLNDGGDDGIPVREFTPPGDTSEKVVDLDVSFDDDQDGDVADAELVDDAEDSAARERAMKQLMATCGKAFPETDAPRGSKTARQRLLRRAAQYAVLGEHRSAKDLSIEELAAVERWVHSRFLDEAAVSPMTYEILDGDAVRFTLGDKSKDVPAPPVEDAAA